MRNFYGCLLGAIILLLTGSLTGCGQSGPLYLPTPKPPKITPKIPPPTSTAQPTTQSQAI